MYYGRIRILKLMIISSSHMKKLKKYLMEPDGDFLQEKKRKTYLHIGENQQKQNLKHSPLKYLMTDFYHFKQKDSHPKKINYMMKMNTSAGHLLCMEIQLLHMYVIII